ncbi:MAG: META domain-containing protein [Gemmobacter sp.]|jgi:heat shock protein HslJ
MKRLLIAGMFLAACQGDGPGISAETIGRDWSLVRMNGADAPANVTMDLSEAGRAAGQAPCNRWFAGIEGNLPAFKLSAVGATRMACPEMEAESTFFAALEAVREARMEGDRLILAGEGDVQLEFTPAKP